MSAVSKLRAELEHLEEERLKLAQQRSDAWRARDLSAARHMTGQLEAIYEEFRRARALQAVQGRPSMSMKRRALISTLPEIHTDPVAAFVRERCELRPDVSMPNTTLVAAYGLWATERGAEPMSAHAVTKRLLRLESGVTTYRSHGRRLYRGINVRRPEPQAQGDTFGSQAEAMRIVEVK
jgi:hypothetical protein